MYENFGLFFYGVMLPMLGIVAFVVVLAIVTVIRRVRNRK